MIFSFIEYSINSYCFNRSEGEISFFCVIMNVGGFMESIYLISSDSIRLIDDEIKKIVGGNPFHSFDLNNVELDDVLEEANYFSLFDEKKYMVVKNASIFGASRKKKEEEDSVSKKDEKLIHYLESPNYNTVLIFTINGKVDSKKKIVKMIKDQYQFIEVGNLKTKELYDLTDHLLKEKGYKADKNIIYYIMNSCLNNYDLVYNEIEKIDLYYGKGCSLKLEDISHIISKVIEDNNFKFIDAVMNRNIKEMFAIYDDLRIQKVEPIMLLSMISKEIRNTLLVKKLMMKLNKRDLMSALDIKFEFQLDKYMNNSYQFSERELEGYLLKLCDFDYKIKNGKLNKDRALQLFLLDICR